MLKHMPLLSIDFDIPPEYIEYSFKTNVNIDNVIFQIRVGKDTYIYTICKDKTHNVLTKEGFEFVQEKYVEAIL